MQRVHRRQLLHRSRPDHRLICCWIVDLVELDYMAWYASIIACYRYCPRGLIYFCSSAVHAIDTHKGPLITYIAAAPSNISAWMPSTRFVSVFNPPIPFCPLIPLSKPESYARHSKVWAKVAQSGVTNGVWASDALIAANGIYKFTIPSTLKPGQYLVRHEIIALHAAYAYPGAQVYPSCFQITYVRPRPLSYT